MDDPFNLGLPRFAVEPEAVITEIVRTADPACAGIDIPAVLADTFRLRPQLRELANVLQKDPDLLSSGRPEGPRSIERLIRALRERGAERLTPPFCSGCGQQRRLVALDGAVRICSSCQTRRTDQANPCAICGRTEYNGRDRDGQPRCRKHPPGDGKDPVAELSTRIGRLDFGLPPQAIAEAVRSVEKSRNGQFRLLWALEDVPGLLTGDGAQGPPRTIALIKALIDHGANGAVVPPCPFCRRQVELNISRDGLRCCKRCWAEARPEPCARCGHLRPVHARTHDTRALCASCRTADPLSLRRCEGCGEMGIWIERTENGGLCTHCYQLPEATCATCGTLRPCRFAHTPAPKCQPCYARSKNKQPCARCGAERWVNNRTPDGKPLCSYCGVPRKPCAGCGKIHRPNGRTPDGKPLCQTCWAKHPAARRPCTACGSLERRFHFGLCAACAARRHLTEALTGTDGTVRPELAPVMEAMLRPPPLAVLRWVRKTPARRAIFEALANGTGPVTHEVLDRFATVRTADNIRAVLVAGGALPARDEQLAKLEKWLTKAIARVEDPDERWILRTYVNWQPLRRFRRLSAGKQVTHGQANGVRIEVRYVVRLLEWLDQNGSSLAQCTQDHVDTWLSDGPALRSSVRAFLHWTSRRGNTRPLTAPINNGDFTVHVIAQDQRWTLVRRLVQDDQLSTADRAAGLLLLLFAQPASRVTLLTTEHVTDDGDKVTLRLGQKPAELPAPLDDLIRQLVRQRQGRAVTVPLEEPKWLFHGAYPGQPLAPSALCDRLKTIGIRPRVARNTSLMEIASELPAYVFSRLLGFHQNTADNWDRERGGLSAEYAAEISRR
ncbi:hypothetical protein GCM10023084_26790 [Streptomyces lacrimifluminis]|uniref:hypothetical protein n=2 Tax=Streptomyces lacrimifluminis TaxID=1500077 RepID=UPI0031E8A864